MIGFENNEFQEVSRSIRTCSEEAKGIFGDLNPTEGVHESVVDVVIVGPMFSRRGVHTPFHKCTTFMKFTPRPLLAFDRSIQTEFSSDLPPGLACEVISLLWSFPSSHRDGKHR